MFVDFSLIWTCRFFLSKFKFYIYSNNMKEVMCLSLNMIEVEIYCSRFLHCEVGFSLL